MLKIIIEEIGKIEIKKVSIGYNHQPPQKRQTLNIDIKIILAYSPKKNKAKVIELYSTLKPATNSPSASGKSKGALLVSATVQIKNITAGKSNTRPLNKNRCFKTISYKFKLSLNNIIGKIVTLIDIS